MAFPWLLWFLWFYNTPGRVVVSTAGAGALSTFEVEVFLVTAAITILSLVVSRLLSDSVRSWRISFSQSLVSLAVDTGANGVSWRVTY